MPSPPPGDEHVGAIPAPGNKNYTLLGADRRPYLSATPQSVQDRSDPGGPGNNSTDMSASP